ncbi:hypothetical protein [Halorussus ruber]|uniref:hypothetical protein n=1 Tax=Halorussus ruber TaxID=1126238 RepID=UPI00109239CE|nr:hypothetical protein [Halorussus ruber]
MRLRTDERGVTVQIGTVLLFAVLIVLVSTYQASVVPQQNEQVEFNHNQQVQSQMQDLRDELLRTAETGSGGSSSIALGTRYPVRAFFVNPSPPSGSLRTSSSAPVRLENAKASGETGDYWDGNPRTFQSRGLTYDPNYNVYQNPPTTVYRNGVLYNRFDGATRVVAGQRLVRGNTVSLVALTGDLSKASSGTASVNLRPVSPAARTVTVENEESEDLSLVVPTKLSVSEWEDLLDSELDPDGDNPDKHVAAVEDAGTDRVRVVLEPGVYQLKMAKVGVGTDVSGVGPHYVTDVRGDDASVAEGTSQKLVVEVRDRYNNPVTGAKVNLSIDATEPNEPDDALVYQGESKRSFEDLKTDSEGQVTVQFEAGEFDGNTREEQVNVSIADVPNAEFDAEAKENLTFDLQVYSVGGPGDGGGGDGPGDGGGDGGASPTVQSFDVTDRSDPCDRNPGGQCRGQSDTAEFDVSWDVTDDDLESVNVYVNKSGSTVETYSGATGSETYREQGAYGDDYTVTLIARDGEGNRACERIADTANGDDSDQSRSSC